LLDPVIAGSTDIIGQGVKIVLNWAVAIFEVVEIDFSHALKLA
jgi:hypothetical protein